MEPVMRLPTFENELQDRKKNLLQLKPPRKDDLMPLDSINLEQLVAAMKNMTSDAIKIMREGKPGIAVTPELLEIIASFARPFMAGALSQCLGTSLKEDQYIMLDPEQMDRFILAVILFGIDIGRYYEQIGVDTWLSGQGYNVPSMNN